MSVKSRIAVCVVAWLGVVSAAWFHFGAAAGALAQAEIDRFAGVAGMVPANESLGYLTNKADGFRVARYAVAPRMLLATPEAQWVVGDFHGGEWRPAAGRLHLEAMKDFRTGVVLLRRKPR